MITPTRRRLVDRLIALGIAVVVVAVGLFIYLTSDIRATASVTGPTVDPPSSASNVPTSLTQRWTLPTDAALGAVVSPLGVVVTADQHTVTAHDAATGAVRWSYGRSNVPLCAFGQSADEGAGFDGVLTVYEKNGFCSQLMSLNTETGARLNSRTSPLPTGGSLAFGGPYGGWLGSDLVEVWQSSLLRTIQYGNLPNPTQPGNQHLGCVFTDLALAGTQFATIEHCAGKGPSARLVLNFDDPGAVPNKPSGWDQFKHAPRTDIDTGSGAARIVGLTSDRVAVLVSAPTPAVVVYDATGKQTSRTSVDVPAAEIVAAAARPGVTPATRTGDQQISLIGSHLISVTANTIQAPEPATSLSSSLPTSSTATSAPLQVPAEVDLQDLRVDWVAGRALGLPAVVADKVLMPVSAGLSVFDAASGPTDLSSVGKVIRVTRPGASGRVDAAAVGSTIVETRRGTVVGLR